MNGKATGAISGAIQGGKVGGPWGAVVGGILGAARANQAIGLMGNGPQQQPGMNPVKPGLQTPAERVNPLTMDASDAANAAGLASSISEGI